jgi:PTS system nitrogen regulatory IIA component
LLRAGGIYREVPAGQLPDIIEHVVSALPATSPSVQKLLLDRLRAPGGLTIAPVGGGFALPHPAARVSLGRDSGTLALICLRDPLHLTEPALDSVPVTRLFFFIAPSPRAHLDLLGRLGRLLKRGPVRDLIIGNAPDEAIFEAIADSPAAGVSPGEAGS